MRRPGAALFSIRNARKQEPFRAFLPAFLIKIPLLNKSPRGHELSTLVYGCPRLPSPRVETASSRSPIPAECAAPNVLYPDSDHRGEAAVPPIPFFPPAAAAAAAKVIWTVNSL